MRRNQLIFAAAFLGAACVVAGARAQTSDIRLPERGICAHRGAMATHPENTLAAFREAIRLGVHQIELDVHLTADGHLAVIHDATVDRTTDGKGRVADMTREAIQRLDAGSHKGPQFAGQRIPMLDEALAVMPVNIWLNVHVKGGRDVGAATARELVRLKRTHQAFLACSHEAADAAREVCPDILICNMERQSNKSDYIRDTIARKCPFIQLLGGVASEEDMARLDKAGTRVNFCCTNDPRVLKWLYDRGVDFPLVDHTAQMMEAAKAAGVEPWNPIFREAASK